MAHPVIGSKYDGPPLDRPCLRKLPAGWYLYEPKEPSAVWPLLGIAAGIMFALLIVVQVMPK